MLVEVACDKFIEMGRAREPITFGPGLNVILGPEHGDNSIGKTTMLLIIDFTFGGSSYAQHDEIGRNVGPHEIRFRHRIKGSDYYFARPFYGSTEVWLCNDAYEHVELWRLSTFAEWLSRSYGLDGCGGSFRDLVHPFMRVYGNQNDDEKAPLAKRDGEPAKEGIRRLLKLYGRYGVIARLDGEVEKAETRAKSFKAACSCDLVAVPANKREVKEIEARLVELGQRLREIEAASKSPLADVPSTEASRLSDLQRESAKLKRRRGVLRRRLDAMQDDWAMGSTRTVKTFESLKAFFPGVDIRRLEEVEGFHKSLSVALKKEMAEERKDVETQLSLLGKSIGELEREAAEMGVERSIPQAILEEYAAAKGEVNRLERSVQAYEERDALASREKELKARRGSLMDHELLLVQNSINGELVKLSEAVCGPTKEPPRLTIKSEKSYEFRVADDTGTGSRVRNMMMLDYVLLHQTPLPAISEDSVSLKQVSDSWLLRLLELFAKSPKQAFIAIDKAESLTDGGIIPEVIRRNTVILLDSDGRELFGRSWNEKR